MQMLIQILLQSRVVGSGRQNCWKLWDKPCSLGLPAAAGTSPPVQSSRQQAKIARPVKLQMYMVDNSYGFVLVKPRGSIHTMSTGCMLLLLLLLHLDGWTP
jgi:hypothetical protein